MNQQIPKKTLFLPNSSSNTEESLSAAPFSLYRYQRKWLNDKSRFKIGMFARQTGKTLITSLEIVLDTLKAESLQRKSLWIILSASERQAKEIMQTHIKRHLEAYQAVFQFSKINYLNSVKVGANAVTLPGGSRILALPANPDTARGFSGNVWLDEFAFHRNSHDIWKSLFPVVSAGHRLIITSTPQGRNNKFFELMHAPKQAFSRHVINIHQAVADGLPRKISHLKEAISDPIAWAQEYELQWLEGITPWLAPPLIEQAKQEQTLPPYNGNPCFLGIDVARRHDLWVAVVLEKKGPQLLVREILSRKNIPFAEQYKLIDQLFKTYRISQVNIDQTGLGEAVVEEVQKRHGTKTVKGTVFTPYAKQHLATLLRQSFEGKEITIPPDDPLLYADLQSVYKNFSTSGTPRFDVDRHKTDGHGDRFWALSLAIAAAHHAPYQPLVYTPVESTSFEKNHFSF